MKFRATILFLFVFFLGLNLFSQENSLDTARFGVFQKDLPPWKKPLVFPDSTNNLLKLPDVYGIAVPRSYEIPDSILMMKRGLDRLSYKKPIQKKPILPFEFTSDFNFNIGASYWEVPILGATTTFSPTLTYAPSDRLLLFGGVGFTQYHNLSYVQNMLAPGWPTKSNITSQAFMGGAFVLNDRITLRGTYQRSLYNQMPSNTIMFAPAFQMATFGADVDVWNGLGVRVERVWEFDRSGRMRSGMKYSPLIKLDKFMKFLKGD